MSYRNDPLVGDIPYELNIGYIDALGDPTREEAVDLVARRFLAAQAIMLALRGVPGIYFHSLYGSRSWANGAAITGQKRTINRQKLDRREVEQELADKHALRARVFFPYAHMLRCRSAEPAFHPTAAQEMLNVHPSLFALWRHSMDGGRHVLCLQNVANEPVEIDLDAEPYGGDQSKFVELLSKKTFSAETGRLRLIVPPYGIYWLLLMPD
ncbi:MAG: alpha-glucosidase C-terminal domain-containing protein [Candidatus Promineifilaceae bacterium]